MDHSLNLLNEREAARQLGVSVATIRRWRWLKQGGPIYRKIGARVLYDPGDLRAFVDARRVVPAEVV
ncbi:MAG: helix-turn-helix domain-containing protein [Acidobacteria bacterium]|nr:helix-turn-helix domain-containing protein [Acidobacteriota bacterium]